MSENTTSSSTRKLKRLLFFLIAIAMIAGSLMAAFLKAMTVKAEENKIVYFDTVKQLEAGHIFKNPKDLITYFVNNTTDPEDGYKTAEKSDIKIIWFEYYGLTENELQWKKNSSEVNDIYGTPLKPGKYTVAFRNVDSGKKWSDTYVSIFYVNAPIKVAYRSVTVDPNTGAKSYKNIKIENAEVTTNPNGSTPFSINVNEKWC